MKVTFDLPVKATAQQEHQCVLCAGGPHHWSLIPVGDEYALWRYTVDGVERAAALHAHCNPLPDLDPDIGKKGVLERYEMTPECDFYEGECDVCSANMGSNGPDPHVITDEGDTLCILCAVRSGIEFTLDPETCLLTLEGHPNARLLDESDIDTWEKLVKEGIWDSVSFVAHVVGKTMPEYQAANEKWLNYGKSKLGKPLPEDAPVWNEEVDGPFWEFAENFTAPFSLAFFDAVWAHLFPNTGGMGSP